MTPLDTTYPLFNPTTLTVSIKAGALFSLAKEAMEQLEVDKLILDVDEGRLELLLELNENFDCPPDKPRNRTLMFATEKNKAEEMWDLIFDGKVIKTEVTTEG